MRVILISHAVCMRILHLHSSPPPLSETEGVSLSPKSGFAAEGAHRPAIATRSTSPQIRGLSDVFDLKGREPDRGRSRPALPADPAQPGASRCLKDFRMSCTPKAP